KLAASSTRARRLVRPRGVPYHVPRAAPTIVRTEDSVLHGAAMSRIVRGGLIQATLCEPATSPGGEIKRAMTDKHEALIPPAAGRGAQVVCLQELFYGP